MTVDPSALLRMLGASPRTASLGLAPNGHEARASGDVQPGQFADLLAKARAGELSSNQPVTLAPGAEASIRLTDDQLARIALAADEAEAKGLRAALVVLDDQQFILDVQSRTLSAAPSDPSIVTGVDGVINLSARGRPAPAPVLEPPASVISSASLARLLAETRGHEAA